MVGMLRGDGKAHEETCIAERSDKSMKQNREFETPKWKRTPCSAGKVAGIDRGMSRDSCEPVTARPGRGGGVRRTYERPA
jgi:hypothetical protein